MSDLIALVLGAPVFLFAFIIGGVWVKEIFERTDVRNNGYKPYVRKPNHFGDNS